jgi:hypothetical protein
VKRLAAALGAVVIGLAIGAVQYLPVREYVAWSPRAGGLGNYESATSYAWPPAELLNAYLPQFSGMLDAYWGPNVIHLHSDYAGAIVLLLAGAAFIGMRTDVHRKQLYFWSIALLISLLWSLGAATPFYHVPYAIIPGTKFFRAPATIFFVGTFALAILACAGLERLIDGRISRRYLIGWLVGAGVIAALASVGGLTNMAQTFSDIRLADRIQANNGSLFIGAWRSFAFVGLTVAVAFGLIRGALPSRYAAWALAALMAIDLWSIERLYWLFSPPAKIIYAADSIVEALKREPQPVRVLALQVREESNRDAFLHGDALMTHRIRQVWGYHGNQIGRYNDLSSYPGAERLFTPNVLALTNTRYLLTDMEEVPFVPNLSRLQGPVRDAAGNNVYLYRVNGDHPYAWVTPIAVKAPDDQVLATVLDPRFNVKTAALFDTSARVAVTTGVQTLPPPLALTTNVASYEPGRVRIDLSQPAPAGSSLVVSENYYPGWVATVDGKPARIGRADYSLTGVELPAGGRSVSLEFTSPAYQRGKVITWLAILLGFVLLFVGIWQDRRRLA